MKMWDEVSARAGRNDLPYLLFTNIWQMDHEQIALGLHDAWRMAEWPERAVEPDMWAMLYRMVGFTVEGVQADPKDHLPAEVVLYRGATPDRKMGMSWTTDPQVAQWFANRFVGYETHVYRTTVRRDQVLAMGGRDGEHEVILDVEQLDERKITRQKEVAR